METVKMMFLCLCALISVQNMVLGGGRCHAQDRAEPFNSEVKFFPLDATDAKIVVATYKNVPPYLFVNDNGELDGFSADIVKCIMDDLGLDYEFVQIGYDEFMRRFPDGDIDIVPGMIINDSFDSRIHCSIPYYQISLSVISRKGTTYSSIEELRGKTIVVSKRGTSYDYLRENSISDNIVEVDNFFEGMDLLSDTLYDALLGDNLSLEYCLRQGRYRNLTLNRIREEYYDGTIAIDADNEALLYSVNKELAQMKIDGRYDKIYRKWLTDHNRRLSVNILKYGLVFAAVVFVLLFGSLHLSRRKERTIKSLLNVSNEKRKEVDRYNSLILNNINAGLVYLTPDYLVLWENMSHFSNDNMAQLYVPGKKCYESHGYDSPCPQCPARTALETKRNDSIEFGDSGYSVEITAIPVLNGSEHVEGVILRTDDVTERKRLFGELEASKERAERSDRFKSAFLANMSHEIRTPLNAIVGFSELLKDTDDRHEQEEFYKIVRQNSEMLLKLINDILDLSKIEAGYIDMKHDEFSMKEFFNELRATLDTKIPNGVDFLSDMPENDYTVVLDKNRLKQVVANFVTNSVKFTSHGHITMGYGIVDGGIRVFVEDTGIGVSKENIEKIFRRFEKLNDFAQGTGLGLAICKSIVESCGGKIGVDSKVNEGSCFWAIIPCRYAVATVGDDDKTDEIITKDNAGGRIVGKKILVAEDNDSNYRLAEMLLRGNTVIRAVNGIQVVEMAKSLKPDIVFMDIRMPVMDGFEATRRIRMFESVLPIVALTANAFGHDVDAAIEAGCNAHIAKPINSTVLSDVMNRYCL